MEGIDHSSDGPSSRPTLTIPNINSVLKNNSALDINSSASENFLIEDLLNKRLTRRKTLKKYVGIGSASAEASGNFEFEKAVYVIDRIASKTSLSISVELASPFEMQGFIIPSRVVTSKYCPWEYKGYSNENKDVRSACIWTSKLRAEVGSNVQTPFLYFTIDNEPLIFSEILTPTGQSTHSPTWNINGPQTGEPQATDLGSNYSAGMFVTHPTNGLIFQARQKVKEA
jgi:hypothetical protein